MYPVIAVSGTTAFDSAKELFGSFSSCPFLEQDEQIASRIRMIVVVMILMTVTGMNTTPVIRRLLTVVK
ncbi:MAG: hypothetical protein A2176_15470 [Spirochaetes bacterium RBG_13_51_14]|nr:MAG: hypothetical protein A2176_15470 [Spirochaetes bacterium RBG_13_51_14]